MASRDEMLANIGDVEWYHTIDLGNGIITPGQYDHRPYLHKYKLPDDLKGKHVIDIGAASGFFSFEFERRGAAVIATDLPQWFDHDFGPNYQPDKTSDSGSVYLHQPFEIASQALGSKVNRQLINIYDVSPERLGKFDIAFCGSVLLHLTDPVRALWNIASVARDVAIIATVIERQNPTSPTATFLGYERGDVWWIPTRACLELMAVSAGFVGIDWVSEFQLDYRDGSAGPYHGVMHCYQTTGHWTPTTLHRDEVIRKYKHQSEKQGRILRAAHHMHRRIARLRTSA